MENETRLAGQAEEYLKKSDENDPLLGRQIDDYLIQKIAGKGGMGVVYEARQLSLDREVAVKFLKTDRPLKSDAILRFEAEAKSAARLSHPNIIHIYSLGAFEGQPYIVMELVKGRNLGRILHERLEQKLGPLPLEKCLSIMVQSSLGLQAASEIGLVHRDLKPENLMMTDQGEVKIADFGLAQNLNREMQSLTETGTTLGTPLYMSPEQVQSQKIDFRTDIYSLGMTFHHLLTGQPPLTAESAFALAVKQIHERPVSVKVLRPECPAAIAELVDWMIEKQPDLRPPSIAQVIAILQGSGVAERTEPGLFRQSAYAGTIHSESGRFSQPFIEFEQRYSRRFMLRRLGVAVLWLTPVASLAAFVLGRLQSRRRRQATLSQPAAWPPGLDMADWKRIKQAESAEMQYQQALVGVSKSEQMAGWLAVPGYFPTDEDWAWRAYVQFTGELVRNGDRLRLARLKSSLEGHVHGIAFDHLEQVILAARDAFDGRETAFLETLDPLVGETMDLNMAGLILALLNTYRDRVPRTENVPKRLEKLQERLAEIMKIS
ncbi:MAG: serine/threonine-protein kinase [bacterium]